MKWRARSCAPLRETPTISPSRDGDDEGVSNGDAVGAGGVQFRGGARTLLPAAGLSPAPALPTTADTARARLSAAAARLSATAARLRASAPGADVAGDLRTRSVRAVVGPDAARCTGSVTVSWTHPLHEGAGTTRS